ncbi:phage tailspike protein [Escherichia coli]|uniref:phage tailspike protein n=1 Tax=Escherichia coli TaxID=562 RepID=UPI000DA4CB6A|nr:phage tailspike protein [Escherichia coli]MCY6838699.1 phage tailspike protein [Escherichia coli]MCZ4969523.1 phage tailspike protein [Escherichia coli]MCZ4995913.1 phage tailspike protein [Escherichia coli]MCZ5923642.1 phage tailspike protein [Escherichia coli]MCZ5972066.1 phage tailspike protein [Escherichia coli]
MTDITANVIVSMPSQLFTMARSFKAVANGKIYIGKIDTDPVNPENRIQVYVENEDGSHVPVSQPIIINAAGYPVYNGQIAKFVTVQGHSMAVYDAYGAQQFYFPNVLKYDPDQLRSELEGPGGAGFVGGLAKPVTWSGFAGGADSTGANNSDSSFAVAALFAGDVYVPAGKYLLNSFHRGNFIVDSEAEFLGTGGVMLKRRPVWSEPGTPVNSSRYPRLFVGDAAFDYSGAKDAPVDQSTWLGKKDYVAPNGTLQPNLGWIEKNATFASYSSTGAIGMAGAAHNKEMPTGGAAIGVVGVGVNDNESGVTNNVWALYLDAKRYPNAKGTTWCAEMAIVNHGTYVDMHSADNRGKTTGISLVAGADPTINGTTEDCTQALAISSNGSKWGAGIAYPIGSLRTFTESGLTDVYQKAIVMRNTHRIGWEDGAGNSLSYLQSRVSTNAVRMGAVFRDRSFDLEGNGLRAFRLSYADGDTGAVRLRTASITDPRIRISAEGISNCSIALEALGTGTVTVNKALTPTTTNAINCGTAALAWAGGATQTAFTVTSDENHKTKNPPILARGVLDFVVTSDERLMQPSFADAILDAWSEVDFVQFQYLDRVEEKGEDGARWHFGVIAQRAKEAFERHGLDAHRFGFFCFDEWDDQYTKVQTNEGVMVTKTRITTVPVQVTKTRIVSKPVMVTESRQVLKDEVLEDGTRIKRVVNEEYQTPKMEMIPVLNEDGSPFAQNPFVSVPVVEDVEEEYIETEFQEVEEEYEEEAEPEYEDILVTPAGSRYGIRYEEALVLEAALQRRNYQKALSRIEMIEMRENI